MATEHITIRHCDICGEKVPSLYRFYWGVIRQEDSYRRHPDQRPENCIETCNTCKGLLSAAIKLKLDKLKEKSE